MKITIFLTLALAAFYVAQAEDTQEGHALELEQDNPSSLQDQELSRVKRQNCSTLRCAASCARQNMIGLCRKGNCQCHREN